VAVEKTREAMFYESFKASTGRVTKSEYHPSTSLG